MVEALPKPRVMIRWADMDDMAFPDDAPGGTDDGYVAVGAMRVLRCSCRCCYGIVKMKRARWWLTACFWETKVPTDGLFGLFRSSGIRADIRPIRKTKVIGYAPTQVGLEQRIIFRCRAR